MEGATPLMRAAKNGDAEAIELLVARGADVSQAQKNKTTALMFAARLGRGVSAFSKDYSTEAQMVEAAKASVAHGADVHAVSAAGQTAMHFAARAADANFPQPGDDLVRFLATHGARLDVADNQDRTPAEMAQERASRPSWWSGAGPRREHRSSETTRSAMIESISEDDVPYHL